MVLIHGQCGSRYLTAVRIGRRQILRRNNGVHDDCTHVAVAGAVPVACADIVREACKRIKLALAHQKAVARDETVDLCGVRAAVDGIGQHGLCFRAGQVIVECGVLGNNVTVADGRDIAGKRVRRNLWDIAFIRGDVVEHTVTYAAALACCRIGIRCRDDEDGELSVIGGITAAGRRIRTHRVGARCTDCSRSRENTDVVVALAFGIVGRGIVGADAINLKAHGGFLRIRNRLQIEGCTGCDNIRCCVRKADSFRRGDRDGNGGKCSAICALCGDLGRARRSAVNEELTGNTGFCRCNGSITALPRNRAGSRSLNVDCLILCEIDGGNGDRCAGRRRVICCDIFCRDIALCAAGRTHMHPAARFAVKYVQHGAGAQNSEYFTARVRLGTQVEADRNADVFVCCGCIGVVAVIGVIISTVTGLYGVDIAGGDLQVLRGKVALCTVGKLHFVPAAVCGFRNGNVNVHIDNLDDAIACAGAFAHI